MHNSSCMRCTFDRLLVVTVPLEAYGSWNACWVCLFLYDGTYCFLTLGKSKLMANDTIAAEGFFTQVLPVVRL